MRHWRSDYPLEEVKRFISNPTMENLVAISMDCTGGECSDCLYRGSGDEYVCPGDGPDDRAYWEERLDYLSMAEVMLLFLHIVAEIEVASP